jgi:murein DD-endopeptidase MepM/ murein hydrolase activator NlpD
LKLAVRISLYVLLALALASALRVTPEPPNPGTKARDVLAYGPPKPAWRLQFDTLARGESLHSLLRRGGLDDASAERLLEVATATSLDERRIPAGMPVTIKSGADSVASEITLQLSVDRLLRVRRVGDVWIPSEEYLPWTTDTIVVGGTIASNLYDAIDSSAKGVLPDNARLQLAWSLADVYDYRVDMSRDLQPGDAFKVVAERSIAPSRAVKIGRVIAATFKLSGSVVSAVRFASGSMRGDYFDQDGKSLRAAFLRAPLEFRRISSVFGMREHPLFGVWRQHKGTDYAADYGTPVRAIGDGIVVRRGQGSGYGNVLEIRHRNGYVTRYGHLSRFARDIHVGSRVDQGQPVAFVGATGWATGPHLHFEVLVNGRARDPRVVLKATGGDPVPAGQRAQFDHLRDHFLASLDSASTGVSKLGQ